MALLRVKTSVGGIEQLRGAASDEERTNVTHWVGAVAVRAWAHAPELALVGFGMLLRMAALRSYPVEWGYDFWEHQQTVTWWSTHLSMPPFLLSRGSYHPQLYYFLCGMVLRLGGGWHTIQALSAIVGCARLGLIWWGAARYLPHSRVARLATLALAAGLPVSVQMDAMMTQEPLNNLVGLGFAIGVMELCRAAPERRARVGLALGAVTGLGLLVKVSNLALLSLLGLAAVVELLQHRGLPLNVRARRLKPWAYALALASCLAAPQYAYNQVAYGKAFVDGWYRRPTEDTTRAAAHQKELLDRRTLGFVAGFTPEIALYPYSPAGIAPTPRFWSALIATAYCDHFNYRFGPAEDAGGALMVRGNTVGGRVTSFAKASVASGIGIAAVVMAAWAWTFFGTLRRREVARPAVLLMPALGVLGALYFAIQYPYDFEGVVKAHYYHFVSAPLYMLFGAATAFAFRRAATAPLGLVCLALTAAPACYSALCVLR